MEDNISEIITLDVGGKIFTTTRTTLCMIPSTFFEALLSGRFGNCCNKKGHYFIDRNPKLFEDILEWMRNPTLHISRSKFVTISRLIAELDFYGLPIPDYIEKEVPTVKKEVPTVKKDECPMTLWIKELVDWQSYYDAITGGDTTVKGGIFTHEGGRLAGISTSHENGYSYLSRKQYNYSDGHNCIIKYKCGEPYIVCNNIGLPDNNGMLSVYVIRTNRVVLMVDALANPSYHIAMDNVAKHIISINY